MNGYSYCLAAGFEPFDISGMTHEGHKKPRYVILKEDLAGIWERGRFSSIVISGGKEAVWAEDVEKFLRGDKHE